MKNQLTQLAARSRVLLQRFVRLCGLPFEIADTLHRIEARLAAIEANSDKVGACVSDDNHQRRKCVIGGHWNDPRGGRW